MIEPNLMLNQMNRKQLYNKLQEACNNMQWDLLNHLLMSPELNKYDNINTNHHFILSCASKDGKLEVVKHLLTSPDLKMYANIHSQNDEVLKLACREGHLEIVKYLLTSPDLTEHANIHTDYNNALRLACINGHTEVVKCLIELGANITTSQGLPLINLCIAPERMEILICLTNENTQFNEGNFDQVGQCGSVKVCKFMIEHANKNEYMHYNFLTSVFIEALLNEKIELIKYLVEIEPNLIHYDDYYCLRTSVDSDNVEIVDFLLDNNADIRAVDSIDEGSKIEKYLKARNLNENLSKELLKKQETIKKIKV